MPTVTHNNATLNYLFRRLCLMTSTVAHRRQLTPGRLACIERARRGYICLQPRADICPLRMLSRCRSECNQKSNWHCRSAFTNDGH